jgi:hypothetical protein
MTTLAGALETCKPPSMPRKRGMSVSENITRFLHQVDNPASQKRRKYSIQDMSDLAKGRRGECLSSLFVNVQCHLQWQCSTGHTWFARPMNIMHGGWCPKCPTRVGEELVRAAFHEAFPLSKFEKTRDLPWLEGLELDGYNHELALAFEYQGHQHYNRVGYFQKSDDVFQAQQERDNKKRLLCQKAGVHLIEVPYTISKDKIREHVRFQLQGLGYTSALVVLTDSQFYDNVRAKGGAGHLEKYKKVVQAIQSRGGTCLTQQYVGSRIPIQIRCKEGHIFTLLAWQILNSNFPQFCRRCRRRSATLLSDTQTIVDTCSQRVALFKFELINAECTAFTTIGDRRKKQHITLQVRCEQGHISMKTWKDFLQTAPRRGKLCSECCSIN